MINNEGQMLRADYYCQVELIHNTVVSNSWTSAPINASNVSTLTLVNNVLAYHQGPSIQLSSGATVTGTNNLFWMNTSDPYPLTAPVFADPLLAPDGYHLELDRRRWMEVWIVEYPMM